jgi:hypothetical protein
MGSTSSGEVVYFMHAPLVRRVKIGKTTHLLRRFNALKTACPVSLEIVALFDAEAWPESSLHARFKKHRLHGEWFSDEVLKELPEDANMVAARCRYDYEDAEEDDRRMPGAPRDARSQF